MHAALHLALVGLLAGLIPSVAACQERHLWVLDAVGGGLEVGPALGPLVSVAAAGGSPFTLRADLAFHAVVLDGAVTHEVLSGIRSLPDVMDARVVRVRD